MRTACWGKTLSCWVQLNAGRNVPRWLGQHSGTLNVLRALGDLGFHGTAAHLGDEREQTLLKILKPNGSDVPWHCERDRNDRITQTSRFGQSMAIILNPQLAISKIANSLCIKLTLGLAHHTGPKKNQCFCYQISISDKHQKWRITIKHVILGGQNGATWTNMGNMGQNWSKTKWPYTFQGPSMYPYIMFSMYRCMYVCNVMQCKGRHYIVLYCIALHCIVLNMYSSVVSCNIMSCRVVSCHVTYVTLMCVYKKCVCSYTYLLVSVWKMIT